MWGGDPPKANILYIKKFKNSRRYSQINVDQGCVSDTSDKREKVKFCLVLIFRRRQADVEKFISGVSDTSEQFLAVLLTTGINFRSFGYF